jgi:hypothetical protein
VGWRPTPRIGNPSFLAHRPLGVQAFRNRANVQLTKFVNISKLVVALERLGFGSVIIDTSRGISRLSVLHWVQRLYERGFTPQQAFDALTQGELWLDKETGTIAHVLGNARVDGTIKVIVNKAGKIATVYRDRLTANRWVKLVY